MFPLLLACEFFQFALYYSVQGTPYPAVNPPADTRRIQWLLLCGLGSAVGDLHRSSLGDCTHPDNPS